MNRQQWLDSLKIGDKVATKIYINLVWKRYSFSYTYEVHSIKNISKSGKIKLDNGVTLSKKGQLSEYAGLGMNAFYCLEPYTQEVEEHINQVDIYLAMRNKLIKELGAISNDIFNGKIGLNDLSDLDYMLSSFRIYNMNK